MDFEILGTITGVETIRRDRAFENLRGFESDTDQGVEEAEGLCRGSAPEWCGDPG